MTPAILTELKRLDRMATCAPWEGDEFEAVAPKARVAIPGHEKIVWADDYHMSEWDAHLVFAMRNSLPALLEAVETMHAVLEEVAAHKGMTNLGECCVDKTCTPAFEDGQKVAYCQFAHGVNRGFNTCAHEASDALARVAALLGEGQNEPK